MLGSKLFYIMFPNRHEHLVKLIDKELSKNAQKWERLRNLDLFVLDNSLRESTVGQLRGHTLDDKWLILDEVKKCGYKHVIVSAFSHMPRVDDAFCNLLSQRESDMSCFHAFSEVGEGEDRKDMPVGLRKMIEYKIPNPIFEIDMINCDSDDQTARMCELLQMRFEETYEKLSSNSKILVNFRDFAPSMEKHPSRVFDIVSFLGTMNRRPFGIIFEDPSGKYLPEQLAIWTKSVRQLMDECNWQSGNLFIHIHKRFEYAEVAQLECLAAGANGVWASVCEEGAAVGHACSIITIINLIRFGNKKVLEKYNCHYLREAAINVTKITTGHPPHPKQTIYGERALDIVLDTHSAKEIEGIDSPDDDRNSRKTVVHELDLAEFFGTEPVMRMTTVASDYMIKQRLIKLFGENEQFTEEMASKMKAVMIEDLDNDSKQEYMSSAGLALLFERAGGKLTEAMADTVAAAKNSSHVYEELVKEVHEIWDHWDIDDESCKKKDSLSFHSFYNGFMSPYFGCYECEESKKALEVIDLHCDGVVEWDEFCLYLKWALNEYPDISTSHELVSVAFRKGIIPIMQKELHKKK